MYYQLQAHHLIGFYTHIYQQSNLNYLQFFLLVNLNKSNVLFCKIETKTKKRNDAPANKI